MIAGERSSPVVAGGRYKPTSGGDYNKMRKTDTARRRFIFSAVFAGILLYVAMVPLFGGWLGLPGLGLPWFIQPGVNPLAFMLAQLGLFIPIAVAWVRSLSLSAKAFFKNDGADGFLTAGVFLAVFYSLYCLWMTAFVDFSDARHLAGFFVWRNLYFAPAGVFITFALLGRLWESRAGEGVKKLPVPRISDTYARKYSHPFKRSPLIAWPVFFIVLYLPSVWFGRDWIFVVISVFMCFLPCAAGQLGAPAAIVAGTRKGKARGIFFKNPALLENAHKIDVIIIEKTGILTENRPVITDIASETGVERLGLLRLAASVAGASDHEALRAIVTRAREERLNPELTDRCVCYSGLGAGANIGSKVYHIGDGAQLKEKKIPIEGMLAFEAYRLEAEGMIPVFLAEDGKLIGIIAVAEAIRKNSAAAIKNLISFGPEIIMVTEDAPRPAARVASLVGITQFIANASPEEKVRQIKRFQEQGKRVAIIGDDAPALAQADVGIAIGEHAGVPARESAGVIITSSDIELLPAALALCRATERNARQNLLIAFAFGLICAVVSISYAFITGNPLINPAITLAAIFLAAGVMFFKK